MASVEDELHSEEARLEQGGPEGLEPELLCEHLAQQSRVGWRSEEDPTGDSHGAFLSQSQGNSPESHSSHCWGCPPAGLYDSGLQQGQMLIPGSKDWDGRGVPWRDERWKQGGQKRPIQRLGRKALCKQLCTYSRGLAGTSASPLPKASSPGRVCPRFAGFVRF